MDLLLAGGWSAFYPVMLLVSIYIIAERYLTIRKRWPATPDSFMARIRALMVQGDLPAAGQLLRPEPLAAGPGMVEKGLRRIGLPLTEIEASGTRGQD
ncbi:MAG: hypothetical protein WKG07_11645 [Hymenobacter sp.]